MISKTAHDYGRLWKVKVTTLSYTSWYVTPTRCQSQYLYTILTNDQCVWCHLPVLLGSAIVTVILLLYFWQMLSLPVVPDLGAFSGKIRGGVSVREGQGVVLMCTPPPHSPGKRLDLQSQEKNNIVFSPLHFEIANELITIHHKSYMTTSNAVMTVPSESSFFDFYIFILYLWWLVFAPVHSALHPYRSNNECD